MGDNPKPLNQAPLLEPAIPPKAAERVWVAIPEGTSSTGAVASLGALEPTQVRRSWRAVIRTVFQALVALCVLFPLLVETAGLDPEAFPWLVVPLAVAGAVAKIMALPQVEVFLRRFIPFLSAAPKER